MATPNTTLELTARGKVVLWLAGLAAGAAWLGGDENARLAAAMLAAPLVVDFVAKQRRLHHTSIRVAPRLTQAGAPFRERITVEHHGRRPLRHCLLQEPRLMRGEPPVLLPTLEPFTGHAVELRERSQVRSHVLERVFLLETLWPLGMFATRSVVSAAAELITEPARVRLRADLLDAAADADAALRQRSPLPGAEFYALREHDMGEDARGVHALRSAAVGTLVRRVHRGRTPTVAGVVLDLRRAPGAPRGRGLRRCEWGLSACASLVEALHGHEVEVRVLLLDATPESIEVRRPAQLAALMTTLSEANLVDFHSLGDDAMEALDDSAHCYWIAAGGNLRAPELQARSPGVTLLEEDDA